ncbi:MAG: hypothetical protein RJQ08_11495 [Salinisphaeraceae bacterium]
MAARSDDFDFESVLARFETSNTKLWVGLGAVIAALLVVIAFMGWYIAQVEDQKTLLANNRIMYAFPNDDGILVSSRRRPEAMVKRFGRDFLANRYTWDEDTVSRNFEAAARMVMPSRAVALARDLQVLSDRIQRNNISQKITLLEESDLVEIDGGYTYKVRGRIERYVASTFDTAYRTQIEVRLEKVVPTESRPSGLWVAGIKEERL